MDAAIATEGLRKRFGAVEALRGIDLEVPPASILGLLGPNGAGKTTAVRILTTILRPDSGTAHVLGVDVAREPEVVRAIIGLAGQYAAVDENLTGRENLALVGRLTHLATRVSRARADELLERFELTDAADRTVKVYSGGMRRRLDVAAALVHRPPVLFLDEPTTGLDPRGRTELWGVIGELVADGTTVLLTTQYLEEAERLADRIVVIDHGLVIADGSATELKARLGGTIVDVTFTDHQAARRAREVLARIGHVELSDAGHTVELHTGNGARDLLGAVRALDEAGIDPYGLGVREPTLDDVFLAITGQPAELEPDGDPTAGAS